MKKITLFIFLCLALTAFAGTKDASTQKVLDATAKHLSEMGGMSIQFTITSLEGKQNMGSLSGTMILQGKKFRVNTPEMNTWYNGKTQWSMIPGDTEVNMSEPTLTEQQAMNPYLFLSLYKKGFNYKMSKGTLSNGKGGYKIYLTADNKQQEIREIYFEVDNLYNPVRVSMRQGSKTWTRIVINSVSGGKTYNDSEFEFPSKKYPQVEIIDLR